MLLAPKMIPRHSIFIVLRVNCFISINFFCLEYVYYDKMTLKFYARNMPVLIIVLNNVNNVVNVFIFGLKMRMLKIKRIFDCLKYFYI